MALTRKLLKSMGLTDEQIDSAIDEHTATVEALKSQITTLKSENAQLQEAKTKLAALEANAGEDYKAKYDAEVQAHKKTKSDYAAKESAAQKETLFRAELTAVGITGKRADQITRMTDLSQYAVKDGKFEDAKAVQKYVRDEFSEFIPKKNTTGDTVEHLPDNVPTKKTAEQIMKISDPMQRQREIAQNLDQFSGL